MTDVQTPTAFDEWCIVELLGHRRLAARVREQTVAGHGFLRLDEPGGRTQLASPGAVYALHPVSEEACRAMAVRLADQPIQRWELPDEWRQPPAITAAVDQYDDQDDDDDEGPF